MKRLVSKLSKDACSRENVFVINGIFIFRFPVDNFKKNMEKIISLKMSYNFQKKQNFESIPVSLDETVINSDSVLHRHVSVYIFLSVL